MRNQKNNQVPFLYDNTTGRICGLRHPDGTEEFIVMSNVKTGTPVNGVKAALTSDMTNANADVTLTAVNYGADGNRISVTYVDPGAVSQALKVLVNGENIIVNLATNGAGAITSICNAVVAAINAHEDAKLLVVATAEGTGLGVVNDLVLANLAGGVTCTPGVPGSALMINPAGTTIYAKRTAQSWQAVASIGMVVPGGTGQINIAGIPDGTTRTKTVRDANDTILEQGGDYTPTGAWIWYNSQLVGIDRDNKAIAQGIIMDANAAPTGIRIPDNDSIDFGVENFTVIWRGTVPDWSPVAGTLLTKHDGANGYELSMTATGDIALTINGDTYNSPVTPQLMDDHEHTIAAAVWRESAGAAGSVWFYVDGILLGAAAITAGVPVTVNNANDLYIMGSSLAGFNGMVSTVILLNYAVYTDQLYAMVRTGIPFLDRWGSNVSIVTGNDSTFAGASNWANFDLSAYDETGDLTITANAIGQYCTLPAANAPMVVGKQYRMVYDAANLVDEFEVYDESGTQLITTIDADGAGQSLLFTATTAGGFRIVAKGATSSVDLDNIYLYPVGATLALEPDGITLPIWYDSSPNRLNGIYPTAGSQPLNPVPTGRETLLSITTLSLAADGDTALFTVPAGRTCVLTKAVLVIGADAGSTDLSIGQDGAETDWLPVNQLDNLNAANDAAILMPVPNTTPLKIENYPAATVIQAQVANHAGGATNTLYLYGILY